MHILIVEDDPELSAYMVNELTQVGNSVAVCSNLEDARRTYGDGRFDIVVLDRMLPDGDGLTFIDDMRIAARPVPVLVLSALGDVDHRVQGLQSGGDDYMVKPFDISELKARLAALRRRAQAGNAARQLCVGELSIDLISHEVTRAGREIRLQPREYKLLEFLMQHSGEVVTRTMLLKAVWGLHFDPQTNVVDVHVSRLRTKLDTSFASPMLHTVRGAGYRLAETP